MILLTPARLLADPFPRTSLRTGGQTEGSLESSPVPTLVVYVMLQPFFLLPDGDNVVSYLIGLL